MRRRVTTTVTKDESGTPILDFLLKRYRFKNSEQWESVLYDKKVMVNGSAAEISATLKHGDTVLYEAPEAPEPMVDKNISVVYEDSYMLVVNKTGNLPCHPSGCYLENTLLHILKAQWGYSKLHLVNRLDRETSGLVLIAKDASSAKILSHQFLSRRVNRFYSVIVEGIFPDTLNAAGWLISDANSEVRKKRYFVNGEPDSPPQENSDWTETRFEIMERSAMLSLINVELITGRLHQIRATLCSLGYPVVGDKIYGVDESIFIRFISDQLTVQDSGRLRLKRQALHARELHFLHPVTREPMLLKAPLPEDMHSLISL